MHISQWITLLTQLCLVLYSFCANLLHSLIMWLMVLSLSPHNLHLLFYCVLFILALIWFVLMALFRAAIKGDSVSLLSIVFMAVISPPSCFSIYSSSHCTNASTLSSMLTSPFPPSFFYTYSLSTFSLGCSTLCMVISFLVHWSICYILT